jgi:hypothetical protein
MTTLVSRRTAFESLNVRPGSWVRCGAAVMVFAVCLIAFGTRLREEPVRVNGVSGPAGADTYAELRHRVEATLPALRVTNDPAEILGREAAIGAAVKAAHPRASRGEVFTAAVAKDVRAVIGADLIRRSASDRASLMRDVPTMTPHVNQPYPTSEALATFPPLLLQSLPRLPDDLEYRFLGRHLIIRDGRTNLIVDYLPDVMTIAAGVSP